MAPALVRAQVGAGGEGWAGPPVCMSLLHPAQVLWAPRLASACPSPSQHAPSHCEPLPSPRQGLELAVPGTYIAGEPLVTIAAFAPQLHVITSKQRPRKLTIHGSDGAEYMFLLKVRQGCPAVLPGR